MHLVRIRETYRHCWKPRRRMQHRTSLDQPWRTHNHHLMRWYISGMHLLLPCLSIWRGACLPNNRIIPRLSAIASSGLKDILLRIKTGGRCCTRQKMIVPQNYILVRVMGEIAPNMSQGISITNSISIRLHNKLPTGNGRCEEFVSATSGVKVRERSQGSLSWINAGKTYVFFEKVWKTIIAP